jgi:hypothetical protein
LNVERPFYVTFERLNGTKVTFGPS